MRSSWVLFLDLFPPDLVLMLLACGYMLNMPKLETAGSALGFVVALLSCKLPVFINSFWEQTNTFIDCAGTAGLYAN
jgi:hypothetical protein